MNDPQITNRNGKSTLIPTAGMLAERLSALPAGIRTDLATVRKSLASAYDVDQTCPVTTQRLLVEFSQRDDIPFWRVVDPDKPFARRLVGGGDRIRAKLASEQ